MPNAWDDPRSVGDLCYNSYWHTYSVILAVERVGNATWITELNLMEPNELVDTGTPNVKKHLTGWRAGRDKFCSFNFLEELEPDSFADYDEFTEVMRDCACYRDKVDY